MINPIFTTVIDRPKLLARNHPDLYNMLEKVFNANMKLYSSRIVSHKKHETKREDHASVNDEYNYIFKHECEAFTKG